MTLPQTGKQLRSTLHASGEIEVSLVDVPVQVPAADEVLIRVQATPINPSDIGLLLGPADPKSFQKRGASLVGTVHPKVLPAFAARVDQSMPVGNEGAGEVIAGDPSLIGKTVAVLGGAMYAQYRTVKSSEVLVLPRARVLPMARVRSSTRSLRWRWSRRCASRSTPRWCTPRPRRSWGRCWYGFASKTACPW